MLFKFVHIIFIYTALLNNRRKTFEQSQNSQKKYVA